MEFSKTQALTSFKKSLLRQTASEEQSDLWMPLAFQGWKPCTESVAASTLPEKSEGYIQVFLNGGLNQQRMAICDAVVVAKILNATLVIPYLDVNRVWQDSSTFKDIFDMDHFINALKDYISIVKELPDEFSWSTRDMAAHSACDFGGGKAEKLALAKYRQVIWQGRVLNSQFTDEELRSQGRCPLTPEEIGLLLAALGFDNSTRLYLASHKVYGGEVRISTLRSLFPLMDDSKSLASSDERAFIKGKASLLAAVDYYISMHSDVFISSSPGNMHNAM
ncbi:hypothetical protein FXO38_00147, partial [Capsicum annuum]